MSKIQIFCLGCTLGFFFGVPRNFFWWVLQHCTGFARLVWGRRRVHRAFIYSNWFVCSVCFCSLLPRLGMYSRFSFLEFHAKIWQQNIIQYNCLRNLCKRFLCLSKIVWKVGEHVLILYQKQSTGKPMSQVKFRQVIHSLGVEQKKKKSNEKKLPASPWARSNIDGERTCLAWRKFWKKKQINIPASP